MSVLFELRVSQVAREHIVTTLRACSQRRATAHKYLVLTTQMHFHLLARVLVYLSIHY